MNQSIESSAPTTVPNSAKAGEEPSQGFASLAVSRKLDHLPVVLCYRYGRTLMRRTSFETESEFQNKFSRELELLQAVPPLNLQGVSTLEMFARYLQRKDPTNLGEIELFREWSEWKSLVQSGSVMVQHSIDTALTIAVALATTPTIVGFLAQSKDITQSNVAEVVHDLRTFYTWLRHQVAFGLDNPLKPIIGAVIRDDSSVTKGWRQRLKKL